ncbi:MAG: hypothetical protein U0791_03985 [Gemmataceae bacterium]
MPMFGQPPDSPALAEARQHLALGQATEADAVVTRAAKLAKGQFGSGSHPLSCAYADMARLHYHAGDYKRASTEFRHAADAPMPAEAAQRADRLAFMFGYAACLEAMAKPGEAEKVLRQCAEFAKNLHGPESTGYAASLEPLASLYLKYGPVGEAARVSDEAYDLFWKHGDAGIAAAAAVRAEAFKALGRSEDPLADFADLPDDIATEAVAKVLARRLESEPIRYRAVLADLRKFAAARFGDGHPVMADTLAAIVHHEISLGVRGDAKARAAAARRAVWSFAIARAPEGVLENIEVGFEDDGTFHLVPQLAREPSPVEAEQLETVLAQAIDDLYARPAAK